jgi:geranylgeranyl diphosphate synthase type I
MKTQDIRTVIQEEMRAAFPEAEQRVATFYAMQEYHLGWRDTDLSVASFDPGKLLRPQVALLACQMVGGDLDQALPLAAGIQLIHDFTLIHDDIEDVSDTRRGRVTVWRQWGLANGINAGDGMFAVAHLALYRLRDKGVSPEVVLEVIRHFDQTVLTICEGQYLDLSFEGNLSITESDYLAMISRKTAALIAAATGLGGIVGGADPSSVEALFSFGQSLGLAFQIEDDVIGIWGDPAVTGKPRAADLYRRKVSLPVVYALQNATRRDDLAALYRQEELSDDDVQRALAVLEEAGSRGYSEGVAAHYHREAEHVLERVCVGETQAAREALSRVQAIVDKLSGRQA